MNSLKDATGDTTQERWDKATSCVRNSDTAGALFLFKSLVNDGELLAYSEIANIYEFGGNNLERDYNKAFHWYKQSLDIANDPLGAYGLGRLYCYGKGIEKNHNKALWYFELASENGVPIANIMIGRIYNLGWGVEKDLLKAEEHFKKAANDGYVYAEKLLGNLVIRKGNWINGFIIYTKGIWHHFSILMKNKYDPRLRSV
ncbi:MAG: sel1 repeat family protein [Chromatiales bacterium]|nr:sel1 repeat family protein [Chromatiales bacterium]